MRCWGEAWPVSVQQRRAVREGRGGDSTGWGDLGRGPWAEGGRISVDKDQGPGGRCSI